MEIAVGGMAVLKKRITAIFCEGIGLQIYGIRPNITKK